MQIFVKSLTAVHMDAPCCKGFSDMVMTAVRKSGRDIPLRMAAVFTEGEIVD